MLHTRNGDTEPTIIDEKCSGTLFSGTVDPGEVPCRRVVITKLSNNPAIYKVEVDAWDLENGEWTFG